MKCFTFEFPKAIKISKVLLTLASNEKMVPLAGLYDIPYIIIPRAANFIPFYKEDILRNTTYSERKSVLYKDYNIYNFFKVRGAYITISMETEDKVKIELFANVGRTYYLIGTLGFEPMSKLIESSNNLLEMLPYNLRKTTGNFLVDSENKLRFVSSSYRIVSALIVTFTTIYALLNLGNKVNVGGGMYGGDAIEYINYLAGKIKELGNDFYEVVENLKSLSTIL